MAQSPKELGGTGTTLRNINLSEPGEQALLCAECSSYHGGYTTGCTGGAYPAYTLGGVYTGGAYPAYTLGSV